MKIIETYGNYIEKWSNEDPDRARWLLKTGWKAQNLKFRFAPDKRLMPADRYLARLMMDTMLMPLEKPQESAIVSIFTPCELLQEAGIHPYNVEGFSCYLSASKAERAFLQQAENTGISETLCSYHKTFIGAAQKKVLPKPKSKRTLEKFAQYEKESADKYVPADLVTPLYVGMTNNLLLGTKEEEDYVDRLLKDVKNAPAKKGKKIYWMHTIPFWSDAVKNELCFQEKAQIVGCELSHVCEPDFDPEKPYEAMARRMVYHALNGSAIRRVEAGIRHAKETGADGAVWFGHWGCKHTLGAAQLAKRKFEEQGIPLLILDGDGCDRSHGGEGQTSTRLGAFLEMLNTETDENTDRQEESHDE